VFLLYLSGFSGGEFDVKVNHSSSMEVMQELDFQYRAPTGNSTLTVVEVGGLQNHQKVSRVGLSFLKM